MPPAATLNPYRLPARARHRYVAAKLGAAFAQPAAWTLDEVFEDTAAGTPVVFILSPGALGRRVWRRPLRATPAAPRILAAHQHLTTALLHPGGAGRISCSTLPHSPLLAAALVRPPRGRCRPHCRAAALWRAPRLAGGRAPPHAVPGPGPGAARREHAEARSRQRRLGVPAELPPGGVVDGAHGRQGASRGRLLCPALGDARIVITAQARSLAHRVHAARAQFLLTQA